MEAKARQKKSCLIIGGTGDIGVATVTKFLEHEYEVILCTRHETELTDKFISTESLHLLELDYSGQFTRVLESYLKEKFPSLDCYVSLLGEVTPTSLLFTKDSALLESFRVNTVIPIRILQCITRFLGKSSDPSVIIVSSTSALEYDAGRLPYVASKGALNSAALSTSRELARLKIRVNVVAPGLIESTMLRSKSSEKGIQSYLDRITLGRLGRCDEVASVIYFLASSQSSYINGQILRVDGGMQ